jgi:hypothetical protein
MKNLKPLIKRGIMMIQKLEENGKMPLEKELCVLDKQLVWEITKKVDIPENRRTIKCKWIFKIKQNTFLQQDWWLVNIVEFMELTSMKTLIR